MDAKRPVSVHQSNPVETVNLSHVQLQDAISRKIDLTRSVRHYLI